MRKSPFGWFSDRKPKSTDRRLHLEAKPLSLQSSDLDPLLGTVLWGRFAAILDSEVSAGTGGALLVMDLADAGRSATAVVERNRQEILPLLAQAIRQSVRSTDLVSHLDACRFVILLRGAPQDVADAVARRILESVDDTVFLINEGLVRLAVGVGGVTFGSQSGERTDLLNRAAESLNLTRDAKVRALIR